ncbi:transglutaminase-like domain-containing protein [Christensenellaceae bacterium OttesenSCG-928-L17]|nr:transglutaminase-like domain-containing protein [Christensenellaceae bacterium OttesenSCG-928-L17]
MKRSVRSAVILLAILTVATALLPITSLANKNSRYLKSGKEISFKAGDAVSKKAAELVAGKKTTQEQAMAIYSFIVTNYSYDYDLYNKVVSGKVTRYTPNPNKTLGKNVGICYDIASLYAAMCRSVGIPTKMIKGNAKIVGGYHAWNAVYDDATGKWISLDLTVDMCYKKGATKSWRSIGSGYSVKSEV